MPTRLEALDFPNRCGVAAGVDKDALDLERLFAAGYGFVEIGSVTPDPRKGNSGKCLLPDPKAGALFNRMGAPNQGYAVVAGNLNYWRSSSVHHGILGVNLLAETTEGFASGVELFAPLADYLTLNLSCPNVPSQVRYQHDEGLLQELLGSVSRRKPILLKVGLDLTDTECELIARNPADGLVIANSKPTGTGWSESGRGIKVEAQSLLERFARLTGGRVPLVAVGGIETSRDAAARFAAGAVLVQQHTAIALGCKSIVDTG